MAIAPGQYPFTGGAVVGGGGTITRDDLKTLTLKKGGVLLGDYNPGLPQPTEIDIPDETIGFHQDGSVSSVTSVANVPLTLFTVDIPEDGVYFVSVLFHVKPTALTGTMSDIIVSMTDTDGQGLLDTTLFNCIDDSDNFKQMNNVVFSASLKAGPNTFKVTLGGAYDISDGRYSVTSLS
jgi:hypothetical protein